MIELKNYSFTQLLTYCFIMDPYSYYLYVPPHPDGMGGAGALVVWAKQLGCPRVGWLGAININMSVGL